MEFFHFLRGFLISVLLGFYSTKNKLEKYHYWDMGIYELNISNYSDEVSITFFNEKKVTYKFLNCYKVLANYCLDYDKEGYEENGKRNLPPCFLQDINIEEIREGSRELYKV